MPRRNAPESSRQSAATRRRRRRHARQEEEQRWRVSLLRSFVTKHGMMALTVTTVIAPGVRIGKWVTAMRTRYRSGTLPAWLRDELESLPGWTWQPLQDRKLSLVRRLREYVEMGGLSVEELIALGRWIRLRRTDFARGKLRRGLRPALEAVPGWSWEQRRP